MSNTKLKHVIRINNRIDQLISNLAIDFTIDKISKAPARFNQKKLDWFNQLYIQKLSLQDFVIRCSFLQFKRVSPDNNYSKILYIWDDENFKITQISLDFTEFSELNLQEFYSFGVLNGLDSAHDKIEFLITRLVKTDLKIEKMIQNWELDFTEIDLFFQTQTRIDYTILKEVCESFYWAFPVATFPITQKHYSYILDQIRAVSLSDFKKDSQAVYFYQKPKPEILKWKKDEIQISLNNLKELADKFFVNKEVWINYLVEIISFLKTGLNDFNFEFEPNLKTTFEDITIAFQDLIIYCFENNYLEQYNKFGVDWWSNLVKNYLTENNLDFGSYLWPIRLALSGLEKSPSAFDLVVILGPLMTQIRIEDALTN